MNRFSSRFAVVLLAAIVCALILWRIRLLNDGSISAPAQFIYGDGGLLSSFLMKKSAVAGNVDNCSTHCLFRTPGFQRALTQQRQGLPLNRFAENGTVNLMVTWRQIEPFINKIWSQEFEASKAKKFFALDEFKYFLPFQCQLPKPYACNVITLGVGNTVSAELDLQRMYPECQFLAVDPTGDVNAELVENKLHGRFVQAAVAGEEHVEFAMISEQNNTFIRMESEKSILDLLWLHNVHTPIDLLLIDVDGAEFSILEQFVDHYDRMPVPICQFNIEVHRPDYMHWRPDYMHWRNYTYPRFFRYFDRLLRTGNFALMHIDFIDTPFLFHRMFFVNIQEEVCTQKFLC